MRNIVYYVAATVDGFICGPEVDISGFISDGAGVNKYLDDLKNFETVISTSIQLLSSSCKII